MKLKSIYVYAMIYDTKIVLFSSSIVKKTGADSISYLSYMYLNNCVDKTNKFF